MSKRFLITRWNINDSIIEGLRIFSSMRIPVWLNIYLFYKKQNLIFSLRNTKTHREVMWYCLQPRRIQTFINIK
ncbi:hypothetical protein HZS_3037 [Henneguya salminicola]|nr:hypothetical protein HZS_3037 [Henneguya salminicola]